MPYAKLLAQEIEASKLSIKEVAEKCEEHGVKITASYVSMIKNSNNEKIPSDDVSRALANVLGVNENLFVIEAYIDKAPQKIIYFLEAFKNYTTATMGQVFKEKVSKDILDLMIKSMAELSLSEFIIESESYFQEANANVTEIIENLQVPTISVEDNSMYPLINKGDKINIELLAISDYKETDILCLKKSGQEEILVRRHIFANSSRSKITLIPLNPDYPIETVLVKDISILGRIKDIIRSLH